MSCIQCHVFLSGLHVERSLQRMSIMTDVKQMTPAVRLFYKLHQYAAVAMQFCIQHKRRTRLEADRKTARANC